jgi:hypothetical protein
MKAVLFLIIILIISGFSRCVLQRDGNTEFINDKARITEIKVNFPGSWGSMESDTIMRISDPVIITSLVEFANQNARNKSHWVRVDSALSERSLININFLEGPTEKATLGFSVDFANVKIGRDPYDIGGTYFEIFTANNEHLKKNVSISEAEKLLALLGLSREDYVALQNSWNNGTPWKSKRQP